MRMPQDIKVTCRHFARRADLIIARLIMMHHMHAAQRIAAAVPSQVPESILVKLAYQALGGLPKHLDAPCISLARRTDAPSPAVSSRRLDEVKALDLAPAEFAQRVGDIAATFQFSEAPSAALCISILAIMPLASAAKHALDIANTHGSKLVYDVAIRLLVLFHVSCFNRNMKLFIASTHHHVDCTFESGTQALHCRAGTSCLLSTLQAPLLFPHFTHQILSDHIPFR
jgi:hypothetical protein